MHQAIQYSLNHVTLQCGSIAQGVSVERNYRFGMTLIIKGHDWPGDVTNLRGCPVKGLLQ
jgi:hypothetical protein